MLEVCERMFDVCLPERSIPEGGVGGIGAFMKEPILALERSKEYADNRVGLGGLLGVFFRSL